MTVDAIDSSPGRRWGALAGSVAAIVGLGVAEIMAWLPRTGTSPALAVAEAFVEVTRGAVPEGWTAVMSRETPLLVAVGALGLMAVSALTGVLAVPRRTAGSLVLVLLTAAAVAAVASRPAAMPLHALPVLVGGGASLWVFRHMLDPVPHPDASGLGRRRVLRLAAGAVGVAGVLALAGRWAGSGRLPRGESAPTSPGDDDPHDVRPTDAAYGAVGDGVTVDSAALRSAAAAAVAQGAWLYLPAGTFLVDEEEDSFLCLNLPAGSKIRGPGTLKLKAGQRDSVRAVGVLGDDITITGITIDMNNAVVGGASHGIFVSGCSGVRIHDVVVRNSAVGAIMLSAGTEGLSNVVVTACRVESVARNGITLYGTGGPSVRDVLIAHNHIVTGVQPIDSEPERGSHNDDVRIIDNYLETGDNYAVTMSGNPAAQNVGWQVLDNHLVGSLWVVNTGNAKITGNVIDARGTSLDGVHAFFSSSNVLLARNRIYAAADGVGVALALSSNRRPVDWTIRDNRIRTTGLRAVGISLRSCGPTTCIGNVIRGENGSRGVEVLGATADMELVLIANNEIDGFATGIYAFVAAAYDIERLGITGNGIDNSQPEPTAMAGVELTGAVANLGQVYASGNVVDPVYSAPFAAHGAAVVTDRPSE